MANPEDILVNVAVSTDDAVGTLKRFGEEGKHAVETIGEAFGPVGEAAGVFLTAISGVSVAMAEFAHHASEAVTEMSHLAAQAGTTITEMSALEGTFASMGVHTEGLGQAFKRLSVQVETQWAQIQKSIKDASSVAINDMLAVQAAGLSVEKAGQSLVTAQQKLREVTTGEKTDPRVAQAQQVQAAVLAVKEAELALEEATQKRADAAKKANDDYLSSIAAVTSAVQSVASGQASFADASKSANLEIQNVIKGLIASAGASQTASEGLHGFVGTIGDVVNQAPKAKDVFYQLADFMKNSGDASLNTALAFRLFGRGVRADMIEALSEGSEALKAHEKHLIDLGLVYTKLDEEIAKGLHKATAELEYTTSTTSNQIGLLFAPTYTEAANKLTKAIQDAHSAILAFAQSVANEVNPVISDFFKLITGDDNFTSRWGQIFGLIQDIGRYIGDILGPIISTIGRGIALWMDVFNLFAGGIRLVLVDVEKLAKQIAAIAEVLVTLNISKFRDQMDEITKDADKKKDKILAQLGGEKSKTEPATDEAGHKDDGHGPSPTAAQKEGRTSAESGTSLKKVTVTNEDGSTSDVFVNTKLGGGQAAAPRQVPQAAGGGGPGGGFAGTLVSEGGAKITVVPKTKEDAAKVGVEGEDKSYGRPVRDKYGADELDLTGAQKFYPKAPPNLSAADREPLLPPAVPEAAQPVAKIGDRVVTAAELAGLAKPPERPAPIAQRGEFGDEYQVAPVTANQRGAGTSVRELSADATKAIGDLLGKLINGFPQKEEEPQVAEEPKAAEPPAEPKTRGEALPGQLASVDTAIGTSIKEAMAPLAEAGASAATGIGSSISEIVAAIRDGAIRIREAALSSTGNAPGQNQKENPAGGDQENPDQENENNNPAAAPAPDTTAVDAVKTSFEGLAPEVDTAKASMSDVAATCQALGTAIGDCVAKVNEAAAALSVRPQANDEGGPLFAGGGHVTGPGSGTSDSINAKLSNNEYVHQEKAVVHYGLDFMDAVNTLKFPKVRGMAEGGLFQSFASRIATPLPHFAGGGQFAAAPSADKQQQSGGHMTVDLTTNHGSVRGLIAPRHVADQLTDIAVEKRMLSTGPKAPWDE